ncbi:HYDIN protein, partial [Leptocoma aspasia]|nr:HYDIN protein [Leptocoma aspasia]
QTKIPGKREIKIPGKRETKAPKKTETKAPEKKGTKAPKKMETKAPEKKETKALKKTETKAPEKKEIKDPKKAETKAPKKGETKGPEKKEIKAPKKAETKIPEDPAEMEKNLILRFQIYESSQQDVAQVLAYWDRVQGTVQLPVIQKGNKSQPSAEIKGQKMNKPQEKVERKPEHERGGQRSLHSSQLETQSKVAEGAVRDKHIGVPCLDIQVTNPKAMIREILKDERLPTEDQMLRHLGLHPDGPPLPPAAVLSIVDYPEERFGSAERAKAPDAKGSSAEGQPKMGKVTSRDNSPKENQICTQRTEGPQDSSAIVSKSMLESASAPTEFLR